MELYWLIPFVIFLVPLLSILFLQSSKKPKNNASSTGNYNPPPSPPGLPIIGNLHQLGKLPHRSMHKLAQKYGPVMLLRLGQVQSLVVSSPETARDVLRNHDSKTCSRPYSHGAIKLSYNSLDLGFSPYSDYWRQIRKLWVAELFSAKRAQYISHVRDREMTRLIDSISESSNKPIELSDKVYSLFNIIICSSAFGGSYELKGYEKFQEAINEAMAMLGSFWAADFFPSFGWVIDIAMGLHRRLEKCFRDFDVFYERVIEEHLKESNPDHRPKEYEDLIDVLLRMSNDETAPMKLSRDHIKSILMNVFVAGIDTGSLTIIWAMTELIRNPRVMKELQSEIRSHVGKKPRVPEHEIPNLKYLKLVVKEIFRLHPPVTLLLPRESMRPCQIGGYEVPAKTRIHVNVWAIGRDPDTWKDPEEFYPERFEASEVDFRGQHYELIPFGAGRRICPSLTMGATNVEFALANLLHCFDWELPDGVKREDVSVEEEAGLTVHKKDPLYLVPIKYDWHA